MDNNKLSYEERLEQEMDLENLSLDIFNDAMNELNDDVARAIAQDVVGDILGQSVVALQSQANVDKTRAAWLFHGALRKPNIND